MIERVVTLLASGLVGIGLYFIFGGDFVGEYGDSSQTSGNKFFYILLGYPIVWFVKNKFLNK
jgi:hypothetical protein